MDAKYSIKKSNLVFLFEHYINIIKTNEEYVSSQQTATSATDMIKLCKEAIAKYDEFHTLDSDNFKSQ